MTSAADVAAAILERLKTPVDPYALQKLLYYSQAWHLAWYDEPLFPDTIEAWRGGPVVPAVYEEYKGGSVVGEPSALSDRASLALDAVLDRYGEIPGHELSDMTHVELPWQASADRAATK